MDLLVVVAEPAAGLKKHPVNSHRERACSALPLFCKKKRGCLMTAQIKIKTTVQVVTFQLAKVNLTLPEPG